MLPQKLDCTNSTDTKKLQNDVEHHTQTRDRLNKELNSGVIVCDLALARQKNIVIGTINQEKKAKEFATFRKMEKTCGNMVLKYQKDIETEDTQIKQWENCLNEYERANNGTILNLLEASNSSTTVLHSANDTTPMHNISSIYNNGTISISESVGGQMILQHEVADNANNHQLLGKFYSAPSGHHEAHGGNNQDSAFNWGNWWNIMMPSLIACVGIGGMLYCWLKVKSRSQEENIESQILIDDSNNEQSSNDVINITVNPLYDDQDVTSSDDLDTIGKVSE